MSQNDHQKADQNDQQNENQNEDQNQNQNEDLNQDQNDNQKEDDQNEDRNDNIKEDNQKEDDQKEDEQKEDDQNDVSMRESDQFDGDLDLDQLEQELELAQQQADSMQKNAGPDPTIQRASNTVKNVDRVLQSYQDVAETQKEDIDFAIDNAMIEYATGSLKVKEEISYLSNVIKQRNDQVGSMITRFQAMENQMLEKDKYILQLESQLNTQGRTVKSLQSKYDDEHRTRVIQETLRQPKEKISVAQMQYQNLSKAPEPLNQLQHKFHDASIKSDPYDFWQSDKQTPYQYPGQPKRLHDVVNPNNMWIAKEGDIAGDKFKYQQKR